MHGRTSIQNNAEIRDIFRESLRDWITNRLSLEELIEDLIQEKQNPEKEARYKKHVSRCEHTLIKLMIVMGNFVAFKKTLKIKMYILENNVIRHLLKF